MATTKKTVYLVGTGRDRSQCHEIVMCILRDETQDMRHGTTGHKK